mgnify:CR=1 FL=1
MKKTISISLDAEISELMDLVIGADQSQSDFISKAIRSYVKNELHLRDLKIINANTDELNAEALDALEYQK